MKTTLQKEAIEMIEGLSDDELKNIIKIMKNYYTKMSKEEAFNNLEKMIREAPDLDYDKELETYREEKYNS